MDPYHGKQLAIDIPGAVVLGTMPFWASFLDLDFDEHLLLFLLALIFGMLRVMVAWNDWQRSRVKVPRD